jgi:hypothetical protein
MDQIKTHPAEMNEALDAIHNTAIELLKYDLCKEVEEGLQLIVSLARWKCVLRSLNEPVRDHVNIEHKQNRVCGGVSYSIVVDRDDGNLWGRWQCPLCNRRGVSSKASSTIEEAVTRAILNLGMHHNLKHANGA